MKQRNTLPTRISFLILVLMLACSSVQAQEDVSNLNGYVAADVFLQKLSERPQELSLELTKLIVPKKKLDGTFMQIGEYLTSRTEFQRRTRHIPEEKKKEFAESFYVTVFRLLASPQIEERFRKNLQTYFASTFDQNELKQLIAFYSTTTGKKLIETQENLARKIQAELQEITTLIGNQAALESDKDISSVR